MPHPTRRDVLRTASAGGLLGFAATTGAAQNRHRVFVRPVEDRSQAEAAIRDHEGRVAVTYVNWEFVVGVVPAENRRDLERDDRVENVEDDTLVHATHHRDDHDGGPGGGDDDGGGGCGDHPTEEPSWGYDRVGGGDTGEYDGLGVDVAVLDTGVDTDHCDLTLAGGHNCTRGNESNYDDKNGHGTHCAGIATADDNDIGVVGVAPAADLYAVKVLGNDGSGQWSWVVCGIDWCMNNDVEVLSMSFGADSMPDDVETAIEDAYAAGHLLVSSAGNDGHEDECEDQTVGQPARHPDTIAVSALDQEDSVAGYSSVGSEIDLIAPGTDIRSTYDGDDYESLSGTSMACPHVSGSAATVWEARGVTGPDTTARDEVEDLLSSHTESLVCANAEGDGLVRVDWAVEAAT